MSCGSSYRYDRNLGPNLIGRRESVKSARTYGVLIGFEVPTINVIELLGTKGFSGTNPRVQTNLKPSLSHEGVSNRVVPLSVQRPRSP